MSNDCSECLGDRWPQLDNRCVECYRADNLDKAWIKLCEAETEWQRVRDALYDVEVASGQRPGPARENYRSPSVFAADERYRAPRGTVTGRYYPKKGEKSNIKDDDLLDDMENCD